MISQSAKARLIRQQLRDIESLRIRLVTCPLEFHQQVSNELFKAKSDLNSLMNLKTKQLKRRQS